MLTTISNDILTARVDSHGAELKSIVRDGKEYMWNGDAKYWGRTSPVLFPLVGALKGGEYRHEGRTYRMSQHGFARDMEFEPADEAEGTISYLLKDTAETFKVYPFRFELKITYRLDGDVLKVEWQIRNTGEDGKPMYFSIGAHPAFNCPVDESGTLNGCYVRFNDGTPLTVRKFADGLVLDETYEINPDDDGFFPLDGHTFDHDALVFENGQVKEASLAGPDKKTFVSLKFQTPVLGIWSPVGKNAPFVCIEPWYGRADSSGFDGDLSQRDYGQRIDAGKTFTGGYKVRFM